MEFLNADGSAPSVGSVLAIVDDRGEVRPVQDIAVQSIDLSGGELTYTDSLGLLIDGVPIGSGGGVTAITAGTGIGVSAPTGAVTVSNTGVTQLTAGTGISLSGSTGSVTVTATGGSGSVTLIGENGVEITSSGPSTYYIGAAFNRTIPFNTFSITTDISFNSPRLMGSFPFVWPFRQPNSSSYIVSVTVRGNLENTTTIPTAFFYSIRFDVAGSHTSYPFPDVATSFYHAAPVIRITDVNNSSYFSGSFESQITLDATYYTTAAPCNASIYLQPVPFNKTPAETYTFGGGGSNSATFTLRPLD